VADSLAFAVPPRLLPRLATVVDEPGAEEALQAIPADSPFFIAGPAHLLPSAAIGNRPDFQGASHAAGVKASARALARIYAALAGGGELDGVRILKAETVAQATALQTAEPDEIVGMPILRSLGYNLGSEGPSLMGGPTGFGYPGAGGSMAYAEPGTGFALAVAKTLMTQGWAVEVEAAVRAGLGLPPLPAFTFEGA
jgi:CubicO group peptidase (beta-lactamase class C family)